MTTTRTPLAKALLERIRIIEPRRPEDLFCHSCNEKLCSCGAPRPRILLRHALVDGSRMLLTRWPHRPPRWGVTVIERGYVREADLGAGFRTRREALEVFKLLVEQDGAKRALQTIAAMEQP